MDSRQDGIVQYVLPSMTTPRNADGNGSCDSQMRQDCPARRSRDEVF